MTKMVKTVILAAICAVVLQPVGMCAVNNQPSSKFWKFGLIGAVALVGVTYLFNRFTSIPLQLATDAGYTNVVKTLVYCGADVNMLEAIFGTGTKALEIASYNGDVETAKFLVAAGASLNSEIEGDCTPLSHAVASKKLAMVKFLVEKGARIDAVALDAAKNMPGNIPAYLNLATDFYSVTKVNMKFEDFAKKHLELSEKKQAEQNCADVKKLLHLDLKNNISEPYNKWLKNKTA